VASIVSIMSCIHDEITNGLAVRHNNLVPMEEKTIASSDKTSLSTIRRITKQVICGIAH
jgi:hypothetical protein